MAHAFLDYTVTFGPTTASDKNLLERIQALDEEVLQEALEIIADDDHAKAVEEAKQLLLTARSRLKAIRRKDQQVEDEIDLESKLDEIFGCD